MKKIYSILFSSILVFSLCGCSELSQNQDNSTNDSVQASSEEIDLSKSEPEKEIIRPLIQPSLDSVTETAETQLAVDFICDFYKMLIDQNSDALDLDKYFNDGELKNRMAECKKEILSNNTNITKEHFAFDYVIPVSDRAEDGVHLITVDYSYQFRYSGETYNPENPDDGWSASGMRAPFAIKDGKIINLEIEGYFEQLPTDEDTPEVQIILSKITAAKDGIIELDGKTFEITNSQREIVIDESAFIYLVTPNGLINVNDYNGETDDVITALKNISELENLGNTGKFKADGVIFNDAAIYKTDDNLLLVEIPSSDGTDTAYRKAMIFTPV